MNTHIPTIWNVSFTVCYFCYICILWHYLFIAIHLAIYQSILYFDHFKVSLKHQHSVCCLLNTLERIPLARDMYVYSLLFFLLREALGEKTHVISEPLDIFDHVHTCASENTAKIRDIIITCKEPIANRFLVSPHPYFPLSPETTIVLIFFTTD